MGTIRKTKSVTALLEIFENSENAISTAGLIKCLKQEMNKTTVYRILKRLQDAGLLHSFIGKDGLRWYAKCQGHMESYQPNWHPHFQCRSCGKTECLDLDISIPSIPGRSCDSVEFLIIGVCEDCL